MSLSFIPIEYLKVRGLGFGFRENYILVMRGLLDLFLSLSS